MCAKFGAKRKWLWTKQEKQSKAKQASNKGGAKATAIKPTQEEEEEEETFVVNQTPAQHLYPTETTHLVF
jgi:hypothetical protein